MFASIFEGAFDIQAIFGGFMGSVVMLGIKESCSPMRQVSVLPLPQPVPRVSATRSNRVLFRYYPYLSILLSSALQPHFLLLCSGVAPSADMAGMAYVQAAMNNVFGTAGVVFITVALILFAFTTLLGNYYFAETGMAYLCGKTPVQGHPDYPESDRYRDCPHRFCGKSRHRVGYRRCSDGTDGSHQRTNYLPDCQAGAPLPGRLPGTETGWEESGL